MNSSPHDHDHEEDVALCGACAGVWEVVTASNSVYVVDLDARTLTRTPDRWRVADWIAGGGRRMPVAPLPIGMDNQTPGLRRDHEPIPLLNLEPVRLDHYLIALLDLVGDGATATTRMTNVVLGTRRLT
ncbi:hypothetical protein [Marmoricola sp. RAF53]|uniref:hypothetical protein n=1 Tax=Marmoricola sp. RAF53 TaxID=3233059 RepID=UPI003F9AFFC4